MRPVGVLSAATTLIAGLLATGTAGAAPPASTLVQADPPTTVSFDTPGEHEYTVPAGVTRVDVAAVGGEGARTNRRGGRAAHVIATLDVTPGQKLFAVVGGSASGNTPGSNGGGAAGGSAGQCVGTPGAGGGATDVRTIAQGESGSDASRVLVAGGGGGAGTLGSDGGDPFKSYGAHRGQGGNADTNGGHGGSDGSGGQAGSSGATAGTATTGGRGAVGVAGEGSGCGGGGGGGYGGGGGGAAGAPGGPGGGGGGGGSLVPGGPPAGMANHGDDPFVSFTTPGLPAQEGTLRVSNTTSLRHASIGGGAVDFANCPSTCRWFDDANGTGPTPGGGGFDFGYDSFQAWAGASRLDPDFVQSFAGVDPGEVDAPASLGEPFLLANFIHYNEQIRFDSPTSFAIQTLVTVTAPAGPAVQFDLRGPRSVRLTFAETSNQPPCDPDIQVTATPCDDRWTLEDMSRTVTAGGVDWHLELLGWRTSTGDFVPHFVTEEHHVMQRDAFAKVTVDTNPTTSTLTVDDSTPDAPVLKMTTTPVPQYGGTVTFTDGGSPIQGCVDVPVGTDAGVTTCTPAELSPGPHTFAASFSGGIGYAASEADPVEYAATHETTTTLEATPNPSPLNQAVTLTATVEGSSDGAPTGEVAFHVDGANEPLATAPVEDGTASAKVILPGGDHTVVAKYGGDDTHLPSTSEPATGLTVTCTRTISGQYTKQLRVTSGTTCVKPGANLTGSIVVGPGARLDVESASVRGSIVAADSRAIRICDSSAQMVAISRATEFVLIGDPDNGCAPNTVRGVLLAYQNTGGLAIIDNTVGGAVFNLGNSGAGPLPGQDEPIVRGNHRP